MSSTSVRECHRPSYGVITCLPSSTSTPAYECAKTITEAPVQHRSSFESTSLPRLIITDTLGWNTTYVDDTRYAVFSDIPLTPLLPSTERYLVDKSCLRVGKSNKSVKWAGDTSSSSRTTASNSSYNYDHLETRYATYPHALEYIDKDTKMAWERWYRREFEDKLERQRAKSCQGRCGEVKIALLQKLRNEEFAKELGMKRSYDAFVNEGIIKPRFMWFISQ